MIINTIHYCKEKYLQFIFFVSFFPYICTVKQYNYTHFINTFYIMIKKKFKKEKDYLRKIIAFRCTEAEHKKISQLAKANNETIGLFIKNKVGV